jgi:hypothetical protein
VPSLFGLAPGGACRAASVAVRAVRSCRTVSPLPVFAPFGASPGGLFSVALSLGSPPPDVIRHRVSVEPGLSSSCLRSQRPPGHLTRDHTSIAGPQLTMRMTQVPSGEPEEDVHGRGTDYTELRRKRMSRYAAAISSLSAAVFTCCAQRSFTCRMRLPAPSRRPTGSSSAAP